MWLLTYRHDFKDSPRFFKKSFLLRDFPPIQMSGSFFSSDYLSQKEIHSVILIFAYIVRRSQKHLSEMRSVLVTFDSLLIFMSCGQRTVPSEYEPNWCLDGVVDAVHERQEQSTTINAACRMASGMSRVLDLVYTMLPSLIS
ncbi:hypothetical protein PoB_002778400 [Plakobranchus ocellatus]|uniref:Uncharacterized protein n=1 Tax=Plakobranchus ocellatus TaxID=259542 RepID=A0AAV4A102_9GAST|nr:hypothetical protein PoB_002778400 [Plakobranchus ocellatus]